MLLHFKTQKPDFVGSNTSEKKHIFLGLKKKIEKGFLFRIKLGETQQGKKKKKKESCFSIYMCLELTGKWPVNSGEVAGMFTYNCFSVRNIAVHKCPQRKPSGSESIVQA